MTTQEPDETGSDLEATAFPAETAETQLAADDARPHSRARSLIFAVGGAVAIAVAAAGVGFGLGQLTHHRHGTPATQPRAGKASASPTATVNGLTFSAFQLVLPPTFEGMHLWAAPNASANSTPTATPYPQPLKAFGHVDDQGASYQDTQGSKSVSVGGMADRSVVQQNPFDGYSFYDQFNSDRPLSDLRDYPSGRLVRQPHLGPYR